MSPVSPIFHIVSIIQAVYTREEELKWQSPQTNLDTSPKSESALELLAGLGQVWRHITAQLVLTQEEIPEEGV